MDLDDFSEISSVSSDDLAINADPERDILGQPSRGVTVKEYVARFRSAPPLRFVVLPLVWGRSGHDWVQLR